jgi:hypothetical protein
LNYSKKVIDFFSNKYITLLFAGIFILFLLIVLPDQSKKAAEYTPENGSFDTSFYYSPSSVDEKIDAYGDDGRTAYIINRWTFDLIFPLVYGLFIFSAVSFSVKRFQGEILSSWLWVLVAPMAVFFDLMENTFVSLAMGFYPHQYMIFAYLASISTVLKWVFVNTGMVLAVVFPVLVGISRLIDFRNKLKRVKG